MSKWDILIYAQLFRQYCGWLFPPQLISMTYFRTHFLEIEILEIET